MSKKPEVIALADLLDDYPLRSKKARDFAIWREAVGVWTTISREGGHAKRRPINAAAQARMAELALRLRGTRAFEPS